MNTVNKVISSRKFVLTVLLLALLVVGASIWFARSAAQRKEDQLAQLDVIRAAAVQEEGTTVILSEEHVAQLYVLQQSGSRYVREIATLMLAENAMRLGLWQEALAWYESLLVRRTSHLSAKARLNSAYVLLQLGRREEALSRLADMHVYKDDTLSADLYAEANIVTAYLLEESNPEQAINIYRMLLNTLSSDNVWFKQAQAKLILHGFMPDTLYDE